jgi:hypothetical protein
MQELTQAFRSLNSITMCNKLLGRDSLSRSGNKSQRACLTISPLSGNPSQRQYQRKACRHISKIPRNARDGPIAQCWVALLIVLYRQTWDIDALCNELFSPVGFAREKVKGYFRTLLLIQRNFLYFNIFYSQELVARTLSSADPQHSTPNKSRTPLFTQLV